MVARLAALVAPLLVALFTGPAVHAQCAAWTDEFDRHGFDDEVLDSITFDDGTGLALYTVGEFTEVAGTPAQHIARWDGSTWSAVGGGLGDYARTLAVFDDGSGAALFAGGNFFTAGGQVASDVARWDGSAWSAVMSGVGGPGNHAYTLASFAGALYLGGDFTGVDGVPAENLARWDGLEWSAVDGGANDQVDYLFVHDDGSGPALLASGAFTVIGGVPTQGISRYDGTSWTALIGGPTLTWPGPLGALDDGRLVATGYYNTKLGVAAWDGTAWSTMPAPNVWLYDYRAFGGESLAATSMGLLRWDGAAWVSAQSVTTSSRAKTLSRFDEGAGERLFVGGDFERLGPVTLNHIARYDGAELTTVGPVGHAASDDVLSLFSGAVAGVGPSLFAGGAFDAAGLSTSTRIARWDGSGWLDVGTGLTGWSPVEVRALGIYDDGAGPALFVGGLFNAAGSMGMLNMARWDGIAGWSSIGDVTFGAVEALTVFDDGTGPALFAGGSFRQAAGLVVSGVARYDGAWSALGSGLNGGARAAHAFATFDDGSGASLFVGGDFTSAGGTAASGIARWDGTSWHDVGGGVSGGISGPPSTPNRNGVFALAVFDDGNGPALFAGGNFDTAGGAPIAHFARWDGSAWTSLPGGDPDGQVFALAVHDDRSGGGPWLYVGGEFDSIGGLAAAKLARWSAAGWEAVDGGTDDTVRALAEYSGDLYVGGDFLTAGTEPAGHVARRSNPCECQATSYCTAGTTSNGCTATLSSTGKASVSATGGFDLLVSNVEGAKQGLIYFSTAGAKATPWGAGSTSFACVRGPHQRTPTQSAGGSAGQCDGSFALDFNAWMAANPGKAPAAGQTAWLQAWFRDPPAPKTTAFSDAVYFSVCP